MKKYVKIYLRSLKKPINLSLEKWQKIIDDPKTLIAYKLDNEEEWSGTVLNKSDVTYAEYDEEYSKSMNATKTKFYKNLETGNITEFVEGTLPSDLTKYIQL